MWNVKLEIYLILFYLALWSTKWRTLGIGIITGQFVYCSLYIKHPNLFGGSEKLDVAWDKGLYDSNVLVAYRRPRPEYLAQQSFVIQVCSSLIIIIVVVIIFYLIIIIISGWKTWKNILKIGIELYGNFQTTLIWIKKTQLINLK